ncbi:MAG: glycosyltransferase family 9 protein [Rhabdochlamydiaceae bacterium]|nr:glycosyltransferase family 9 protein [Rhabdochlamydiaceae bacterium]
MQSILLVRTSAIGDVIQTLPVLEYLSHQFPTAQIDWVVEKGIAPLLEQIEPCRPRRVLAIDTKKWIKFPLALASLREIKHFYHSLREVHYDLLFDLQGNSKSALVTMAARAKEKVGFGAKCVREKTNLLATTTRYDLPLELNIRLKYLGLLQRHFKDDSEYAFSGVRFQLPPQDQERLSMICSSPFLNRPLTLMVAVGSKWANKRLNQETLHAFLAKVADRFDAAFVFIYGSDEERFNAEKMQRAFANCSISVGQLSLPLWQALMWKVDGVIAVDSAALHLAGTTKTPTFSVFGPTSAELFKPMESWHHAFQGDCPYGKSFVKQCALLRSCATGACIKEISPEALFRSFEKWHNECLL